MSKKDKLLSLPPNTEDRIRITFCQNEKSLYTDFFILYSDIPKLIEILQEILKRNKK